MISIDSYNIVDQDFVFFPFHQNSNETSNVYIGALYPLEIFQSL